tara:strand:+ start:12871 stop:13488 length:618 start_codon:yes stop_codon:yes gene_type:complete
MAVIDSITIGGDSFSVYALTAGNAVSETTTFFNGRLGPEATAWAAAVTAAADDEKRALAAAADWLDRASLFTGTKTVSTQDRDWPRDGATDGCTGLSITDGTTPDDIFRAQAWLAGAILVDSSAAASTGEGGNIKSAKAGSAQVVFFRPTEGTSSDTRLPKVADDYARCFTDAGTSAGISAPTFTGTSQVSGATQCDDELTEGYA